MTGRPDDSEIQKRIQRGADGDPSSTDDLASASDSDAEAATLAAGQRGGDADTRAVDPDLLNSEDELTLGLPGSTGAVQGETLGPYRLVRELGRGGQGLVYLAEDSRLGRKVALKLLSGFALGSSQGLIRFRREAEAASRLDDPGICTVYETGELQGLPFIAMQYIDGETLSSWIKAHRRGESSAPTDRDGDSQASSPRRDFDDWVQVLERVARSLHAAHEVGLVHRDIKPANIMIARDGRPVILDFGLARADDLESQVLTRSGDLLGTPAYMAPEQIIGQAHDVDRRADVYALGVTLFESLTRQRPHTAPTREALYRQIVDGAPPPASRIDPRIPRDLDVIVQTALERDPDRRYQTASALADDLRRFRQREPIAARPAGPLLKLGRWAERNPALATAVILLFLFLSVGLGVVTSLWRKSESALIASRKATTRADQKTEEARANLRDYEMLSDLQRFEDYIEEIEMLYPPDPVRLPAIAAWKAKLGDLCAQKPLHESRLAALRSKSRELGVEEIIGQRPDPNVDTLLELDRRLAGLEIELRAGKLVESRRADLLLLKARLLSQRENLVAAIVAAHRFHFDDVAQDWKHLNLERLIRSIELLESDAPSPLSEVLFLEDQCRRVAGLSIEGEHARLWREAVARIARPDSPYAGLVIEPQLGLRPLGPDPRTGLEEFAQVLTGEVPERNQAGDLVLVPGFATVLTFLPGGDFTIVFDTADRPQAKPGPRQVELDPFFMSKYELTIAQWETATGESLRHRVGTNGVTQAEFDETGNLPLGNVAWEIALKFMLRIELRIPSELQWEYAARGGATGTWPMGEDALTLEAFANIAPDPGGESSVDRFTGVAPVGSFRPNPFGLHDALGNLWEFTRDGLDVDQIPLMSGDGQHSLLADDSYVIRGGGFRNGPDTVRFTMRASIDRSSSTSSVGLRPSRPLLSGAQR